MINYRQVSDKFFSTTLLVIFIQFDFRYQDAFVWLLRKTRRKSLGLSSIFFLLGMGTLVGPGDGQVKY
jgi:hypothetical protein